MTEDEIITVQVKDLRRCMRAAYQAGKCIERINNATDAPPWRYRLRVSVGNKKGNVLIYLINLDRLELEDQPGRLLGYVHPNTESNPGNQAVNLIIERIHELKIEKCEGWRPGPDEQPA